MNIDWHKLIQQLLYDKGNPLLFNSSFFLYYLLILMVAFRLLIKAGVLRIFILTLFSLYFFYKASGWYVVFLVIAAVVDFNLSNFIFKAESRLQKKLLLIVSIVLNLGFLCYFKYTNLFLKTLNDLSAGNFEPMALFLPIGISFYTFENLSYTIDVYRGKFTPVKRFIDYLFFLSFFPKLIMGPIVRASDFIPQIYKTVQLNAYDVSRGLFLILTGLFKKVIISDFIYLNLVRYVFEAPLLHTGMECLFAVYGYALVIYCDFSGYSDMAIGIAKWMGIDININFLAPYQSSNITEFWRRWHISLSSWLRDYLYIPLGGSRISKVRTYINLFITMLLGGLWHGASWNFVLWGGMHGTALAVHKWWNEKFPSVQFKSRLAKIAGILITFHFVCFCWIFFKAETITDAIDMIRQIGKNFYWQGTGAFLNHYISVIWVMAIGFMMHFLPMNLNEVIIRKLASLHWTYKAIIATLFILLIVLLKQTAPVMPIYLQF